MSSGQAGTTRAILFDDGKGRLSPLTDLRTSFELRVGALTTWERQCAMLSLTPAAVCAPTGLAELTAERWSLPLNRAPDGGDDEPVLLINGRCALPPPAVAGLTVGQVLAEAGSADIIAARLTLRDARSLLAGRSPEMEIVETSERCLMATPWDWCRVRKACIAADMPILLRGPGRLDAGGATPPGVHVFGDHPVRIHPSATITPGAVLDATEGPVVIDENVTVRPFALVVGPAYVGPGSWVLEHAHFHGSVCGPVCKLRGEIGGCTFQGYANKAHEGHLGDCWVGEWVNLGAGTTNSNLLNTYTPVAAQATPGGRREDTGLVFFGGVLGDHTKTAICSKLYTGSIAGTGTMFAASAPLTGTIGAFRWMTDAEGDKPKHWRLGRFMETAIAAMGRRGVSPSVAYSRRLTVLYETATGAEAMSWPGKDRSHLGG
jgi:UDP-N-acetylglucosamine diphosphorylase/glucosamine-1-phosphate N-acetyltransferase